MPSGKTVNLLNLKVFLCAQKYDLALQPDGVPGDVASTGDGGPRATQTVKHDVSEHPAFTWFTNWNLKPVFGSCSSNNIVFEEMTFSWQATCSFYGFYQAGKRADHSREDQSPALWKCRGYGNRAPLLPEGCSLLVCSLVGCTAHLYPADEWGQACCWQYLPLCLGNLRLWTQVI